MPGTAAKAAISSIAWGLLAIIIPSKTLPPTIAMKNQPDRLMSCKRRTPTLRGGRNRKGEINRLCSLREIGPMREFITLIPSAYRLDILNATIHLWSCFSPDKRRRQGLGDVFSLVGRVNPSVRLTVLARSWLAYRPRRSGSPWAGLGHRTSAPTRRPSHRPPGSVGRPDRG